MVAWATTAAAAFAAVSAFAAVLSEAAFAAASAPLAHNLGDFSSDHLGTGLAKEVLVKIGNTCVPWIAQRRIVSEHATGLARVAGVEAPKSPVMSSRTCCVRAASAGESLGEFLFFCQ